MKPVGKPDAVIPHVRFDERRTARPPPQSAPTSSSKRHARRAAQVKQTHGLTNDGLAVHSFPSLLADLATLTRNEVVTAAAPDIVLTLYARPAAIQQKTFDLLAIDPARTQ